MVDVGMTDAPSTVRKIMEGMKSKIDDIFDVKAMSVRVIMANKELLVRIFLECGKDELEFIKTSGFYLGFLFGIVQSLVYIFYREWWVLPVFGLLVGWLTNQVALFVLFKPVHPTTCCWREKCCGYLVQGLFLQPERRQEVARIYGNLVGNTVLRAKNIVEDLQLGDGSMVLWNLIRKVVDETTDKQVHGFASAIAQFAIGDEAIDKAKHVQAALIMQTLPEMMLANEDFLVESFDVANTLHARLRVLSPDKFERILHSVFEEDEI